MRTCALLIGAIVVSLFCAGCSNSSTFTPSVTDSANIVDAHHVVVSGAATDPAAAALISTCIADYEAEDFGQISGSDGSSDPAPYCNCVIPSWLASGDSAAKIAAAMKSDSTDGGGGAPIGFSQQQACSQLDPTIDPHTGIPYSG
jgi:hypothetical protein